MTSSHVLLEREQELELLTDLLAAVDSTGGRVILVRGEAGIGKSSLVRDFISTHADEAHILVGWCDDLMTPQALGPFWDIARSETSLIEPLAGTNRRALLEAVMDLLSRTLRPTVLVLEDTQWADEATLDTIQYLGRRIEQTNALMLLTYRDGEVDFDHPLRHIVGGFSPTSVIRIQLEGLSPSAVSVMLGTSDLDTADVIAATDGNPFLITEMASAHGDAVPSSVQDSVMARVAKLSAESQKLLRILSVIPKRVSRAELAQLAVGYDLGLEECERRGLLHVGTDFVAFRHDLIRRAVEESLTTNQRITLNRAVLDALPPDTDPARLVHHASRADDIDRLVDLAPKAAAAAIAVASHREARDHFRQLSGYLDRVDPNLKGPILERWAMEELIQGSYDEAIRLSELAVLHYRDMDDRSAEASALGFTAVLLQRNGQHSAAERLARRSVDVLGPHPDGNDLARSLGVDSYLAMMASDWPRTLELVDQTLAAADSDVDEQILIRALNHRGTALSMMNYPDGADSFEEALRRANDAGDTGEARRALVNRAETAIESFDLSAAWDDVQKALDMPLLNEAASGDPYSHALRAKIFELRGQWSQAMELARDDLDFLYLAELKAVPVLSVLEARTGQSSARASTIRTWEMAVAAGEHQNLAPAAAVLAEHAWISGDTDIPISDIKNVMETGLDKGYTWTPASIAFWLWKLGELAEVPDGIAEPYRLTIEGDPMAAAERWATIGCPYERAIALTHGDQSARLEALDELDALRATAVYDKLRQELKGQGVSVPRRRTSRTTDHAAGLTARQAEVLELLAEQLSNADIADQLFLSPRTVEHHVAAVMSKLDAGSRDEAVATATDMGLLGQGTR